MRKFFCLVVLSLALAVNANTQGQPSLKDAYRECFMVGAALNSAQFTGQDTVEAALVKAQFNSISPENVLKWEVIHPQPGVYDFSSADKYVEFGCGGCATTSSPSSAVTRDASRDGMS